MATEMLLRNVAPTLYVSALQSAWRAGAQIYDPSIWLYREPEIDEKMMRDADIAHVIGYRTHLIAAPEWNVRPTIEKDPGADLAAKVATDLLANIRNFTQSRRMLSMAFLSGARYAEIRGEYRNMPLGDGKIRKWWVPTQLKDMDKKRFRLVRDDWGQRGTGNNDPHARHVELHWEYWSVDREEWIALTDEEERRLIKNVYMDDEASLGHGRGLRDALGWWWYAKEHTFQESLEAVERFAQGILTAKVDGLRDANTLLPNTELVRQWMAVLEDMRSRHILVFDKEDEVEVVRMGGEGWQLLSSIREELKNTIFSLVLAANLPTGGGDGETGSYGKAAIQENSTETLVQFDREVLEESIRDDLIGYLWWKNWRNIVELGLDAQPLPRFDLSQEQMQDPEKSANVATSLLGAGVDLVAADVYEKTGFKQPEQGEEIIEGGGGQPPMGPMGGGGMPPTDGFPGPGEPQEPAEPMSRRNAEEDEGRAVRPVPDEAFWLDPATGEIFREVAGELVTFDRWDESKVNRVKAGTAEGGQFAPTDGGSSSTSIAGGPTEAVSTSDLKRVGGQGGSNPGGMYENDAGDRWYIKKGRSPSHVNSEVMAAKLYRLAGVHVPEVEKADYEGSLGISSKIEKVGRVNAASLREAPGAVEAFAMDAWLANWDVIGLEYDNMLVTDDGDAIRLDTGGALKWRAQGEPKGQLFGDAAAEVDSMRKMGTAKHVFGHLTDENVAESIREYVLPITDQQIRAMGEEYDERDTAETLIKRKAWMGAWARNVLGANFQYSVRYPDTPEGQPRCDAGQPTGGEWAPQVCGGPKGGSAAAKADWVAQHEWSAHATDPHKGSWSPKKAAAAGQGAVNLAAQKAAKLAGEPASKLSAGTTASMIQHSLGAYFANPTPEGLDEIGARMRMFSPQNEQDEQALQQMAQALGFNPWTYAAVNKDGPVRKFYDNVHDKVGGQLTQESAQALGNWAWKPTQVNAAAAIESLAEQGMHGAAKEMARMYGTYYETPSFKQAEEAAEPTTAGGWKKGDQFTYDNDTLEITGVGEENVTYKDAATGQEWPTSKASWDEFVATGQAVPVQAPQAEQPKVEEGAYFMDDEGVFWTVGAAYMGGQHHKVESDQGEKKMMSVEEIAKQDLKTDEKEFAPKIGDTFTDDDGDTFKIEQFQEGQYWIEGPGGGGQWVSEDMLKTLMGEEAAGAEAAAPTYADPMNPKVGDKYTFAEQPEEWQIVSIDDDGTVNIQEVGKPDGYIADYPKDSWESIQGSKWSGGDKGFVPVGAPEGWEAGEAAPAQAGQPQPTGEDAKKEAADLQKGIKDGVITLSEAKNAIISLNTLDTKNIQPGMVWVTDNGNGFEIVSQENENQWKVEIYPNEAYPKGATETWTKQNIVDHYDAYSPAKGVEQAMPDGVTAGDGKDVYTGDYIMDAGGSRYEIMSIDPSNGDVQLKNIENDATFSVSGDDWADWADDTEAYQMPAKAEGKWGEYIGDAALVDKIKAQVTEDMQEVGKVEADWGMIWDAAMDNGKGVTSSEAKTLAAAFNQELKSQQTGQPVEQIDAEDFYYEASNGMGREDLPDKAKPAFDEFVKSPTQETFQGLIDALDKADYWYTVDVLKQSGMIDKLPTSDAASQTKTVNKITGDEIAEGMTYKFNGKMYTVLGEGSWGDGYWSVEGSDGNVGQISANVLKKRANAGGEITIPPKKPEPTIDPAQLRSTLGKLSDPWQRMTAYAASGIVPELKGFQHMNAMRALTQKATSGEDLTYNEEEAFRSYVEQASNYLSSRVGGTTSNKMSGPGWAMYVAGKEAKHGTWAQENPIDKNWTTTAPEANKVLSTLWDYTMDYDGINHALRTGSSEGYEGEKADLMRRGFRQYPRLPQRRTLYRGINTSNTSKSSQVVKDIKEAWDQGYGTVRMKGLQSTSTSESFAESWAAKKGLPMRVVLDIETDHGIPMRSISQISSEDEVILAHDDEYEVEDYQEFPNAVGSQPTHRIRLRHVTNKYPRAKGRSKQSQESHVFARESGEREAWMDDPNVQPDKFLQPPEAIRVVRR